MAKNNSLFDEFNQIEEKPQLKEAFSDLSNDDPLPQQPVEEVEQENTILNEDSTKQEDPLFHQKKKEAILARRDNAAVVSAGIEQTKKELMEASIQKQLERNQTNQELAQSLDTTQISRQEFVERMGPRMGADRASIVYGIAEEAKLNQDIEQLRLEAESMRERSVGEIAEDSLIGLQKSIVGIGQMAYGLADITTVALDKTLGQSTRALQEFISTGTIYDEEGNVKEYITAPSNLDAVVGLSEDFQRTREILNAGQSSKLKAQKEIIQQEAQKRRAERVERYKNGEEGWWDTIKEEGINAYEATGDWLNNPSALLDASIESSLSMLVPGSVVKGALGKQGVAALTKKELTDPKAIAKQSEAIAAASIGLMEGTSNYVDTRAEVMGTNFDVLYSQSELFKDLVDNQGLSNEQAREVVANNAALSTAAISASVGAVSSKLSGAAKLEGNLFKTGSASASLANAPVKGLVGGAKEAVEEGVQSGLGGQLAQNIGKKLFADKDQDLSEGVGEAIGAGTTTGAATGGAFSTAGGVAESAQTAAVNKIVEGLKKQSTASAVVNEENVEELDTAKEDYDPKQAIDILMDKRVLGNEKYQDAKSFSSLTKEMQKHLSNYEAKLGEQSIKADEGQLGKKEEKTLEKDVKEYMRLKETFDEIVAVRTKNAKSEDIQETINKLKNNDTVSEDEVNNVVSVLGSSPDSFSKDDLVELSKSNKLSKKDKDFVQAVYEAETKIAAISDSTGKIQEVSSDVFRGTKGNLGVLDHRKNMLNSLRFGNTEEAKKSYRQIRNFEKSHTRKAKLVRSAYSSIKSGKPNTNVINKVKEEYGLSVTDKTPVSLVKTIEAEASAITAVRNQMAEAGKRLTGLYKENAGFVDAVKNTTKEKVPEVLKKSEGTVSTADDLLRESAETTTPQSFEKLHTKQAKKSSTVFASPTSVNNVFQEFRQSPTKQNKDKLFSGFIDAINNNQKVGILNSKTANALKTELQKSTSLKEANKVREKFNKSYKTGLAKTKAEAKRHTVSKRKEVSKKLKEVETAIDNTNLTKAFNRLSESVGFTPTNPNKSVEAIADIEKGIFMALSNTPLKGKDKNNINVYKGYRLVQKLNKEYSLKDELKKTPMFNKVQFRTKENSDGVAVESSSLLDTEVFNSLDFTDKAEIAALNTSQENKNGLVAIAPAVKALADNIKYVAKNNNQNFVSYLGAVQDGTIPNNLLNTLALDGLDWFNTRAGSTINPISTDIEDALSSLGDTVNKEAYSTAMKEHGYPANTIYRDIGRSVTSKLGIEPKDDAAIDYLDNLQVKIGQSVVSGMLQSNLVKLHGVPNKELFDSNTSEGVTYFLQAVTDNKGKIPEYVEESVYKPLREHPTVLDSLFGSIRGTVFPSLKPKKSKTTIKNTDQLVPKEALEIMNTDNTRGSKFKEGMMDLLGLFKDEELVTLGGGVTDLMRVPLEQREDTEKGKNGAILNKFKDLEDFYGFAKDKEFYFTNVMWQNQRIGVESSINMQASKIERHIMYRSDWEATVDVNDTERRELFLKTVANNLKYGHDKNTNKALFDDGLVAELINNPHITKAAASIRVLRENKNIPKNVKLMHKNNVMRAMTEVEGVKPSMAALDALDALSYYEADKPFKTTIGLEVDGMTNGPAFGVMQFPIDLTEEQLKLKLNRAGIYLPNQEYSSATEWKDTPGNYDNYESMSFTLNSLDKAIRKRRSIADMTGVTKQEVDAFDFDTYTVLKSVMGDTVSFLQESVEEVVEKVERDISKDPTMKGVYGQGAQGMANDMANKVIETLVQNAVKELTSEKTKEGVYVGQLQDDTRHKLVELHKFLSGHGIGLTQKQMNQLASSNTSESITDFKLTPKQKEVFVNGFNSVFTPVLRRALEVEQPNIINTRTMINEMSNFNYQVYQAAYEQQRKKIQKGKQLTVGEHKQIQEAVFDLLPVYRSMFSEDRNHGITLAKQEEQFNNKVISSRFGTALPNVTSPNKENIQTLSAGGKEPFLSGPGSRSTVMGIHSSDATVQLKLMKDFNMLNVHDAQMAGINTIGDITQKTNQLFLEVNEQHSIFEQFLEQYKHNKEQAEALGLMPQVMKAMSGKDSITTYREYSSDGTAFYNHNRMDEDVTQFTRKIENSRANLFKLLRQEGTSIGQYVLEGYSYIPTETENNITQESVEAASLEVHAEISALAKEMASVLGSAPNNNQSKFNPNQEITIDSTNSSNLLKQLYKSDTVPTNSGQLGSVLDNLVNKTLTPLKVAIENTTEASWGTFNRKNSNINLSLGDSSKTIWNQSHAEIYVHELVHATTARGIDQISKGAIELERLFKIASKHIKVSDLYPVNATNKQKADAQKMYEYVFENKESVTRRGVDNNTGMTIERTQNNYLHEFMALGLTNEQFANALRKPEITKEFKQKYSRAPKEQTSKLGRLLDNSVVGALRDLFDRILNYFAERLRGTENLEGSDLLLRLAQDVAEIDNKASNFVQKSLAMVEALNTKTGKVLEYLIVKPLRALKGVSVFDKTKNRTLKNVKNIAARLPNLSAEGSYAALQDMMDRYQKSKDSLVASLAQELAGITPDTKHWHLLLRMSNMKIDQLRKQVQTSTKRMVNAAFTNKLERPTKEAITRVLLKTDAFKLFESIKPLASLSGTALEEYVGKGQSEMTADLYKLKSYLEDPANLSQAISAIENKIRGSYQNHQFYIRYGRALGKSMTDGKIYEPNQHDNTYQIANLFGAPYLSKVDDSDAVMNDLDTLTSLYAIRETSTEDKGRVLDAINQELNAEDKTPYQNGIVFTLQMAAHHRQESTEKLFNNDLAHVSAGYVKETFNPHIGLEVAPLSKSDEMESLRYVQESILPKDSAIGNMPQMALYKSRHAGMQTYLQATMSTTGKRMAGTDLIKARINQSEQMADGSYILNPLSEAGNDMVAVKKRYYAAAKQRNNGKVNKGDIFMLKPVYTPSGDIAKYRYVMSDQNKRDVLERNDAFDDVLGATRANLEDKVNSEIINTTVINMTKAVYDDEFSTNPKAFIKVGPNSQDSDLVEMWAKLSDETKEYARSVFGSDGIPIKKSHYHLVFGFRKLSITQAGEAINKRFDNATMKAAGDFLTKLLDRKGVRLTENLVMDLATMAKDTIVIKTGAVFVGNVMSNTLHLMLEGIPRSYVFKHKAEGFKLATKYQQDRDELDEVEIKLASDKLITTAERNKLLARREQLRDALSRNPLAELVDAGVYQTIVEDVDLEEDNYSYLSQIEELAKPVLDRIPEPIKDLGNTAFLTHDTKLYKTLRNGTQMSDFVARYVLHKWNLEHKKMSPKDSIDYIVESYINYDVPTHPIIQYGNDLGLVMFTKYFLRIQKVMMRQFKENPFNVLMLMTMQSMFNVDTPDIYDTFMPTANIGARFYDPWENFQTVFQVHAAEFSVMP